MPLHRRLPKRGFSNYPFRKTFAFINVADIERYSVDGVLDFAILREKGVVARESRYDGLKILGQGEMRAPITVKAHKFSASAIAKIEAAGGKAEVIA